MYDEFIDLNTLQTLRILSFGLGVTYFFAIFYILFVFEVSVSKFNLLLAN